MENVDNLILEHLKALRNEVRDMRRDLGGLTLRVGSLEQHVAGARNDIMMVHGDLAIMHQRDDTIDDRLLRIEQRLEVA